MHWLTALLESIYKITVITTLLQTTQQFIQQKQFPIAMNKILQQDTLTHKYDII